MTKIILDAGHGGTDPGATGNGLFEKHLTLKLSQLTKTYLERNYEGVSVLLTRTKDSTMSLIARTTWANKQGADSLVSIHINATGSVQANGYEDFRYIKDGAGTKSLSLQSKIHGQLSPIWKDAGRANRGMKSANFHMVREFRGAAVLVEFGFISNPSDARLLKDLQFLEKNAEGLAKALADYHNLKAKKAPVKAPVVKPVVKPVAKPVAKTQLVEITHSGGLAIREVADFDAKIVETVQKGEIFTIAKRVKSKQGAYMYQLKSGLYVTASSKYVKKYTK